MVREIINAKNSCLCPRLLYSTWKKSNIRSNRNIWIKNHIIIKWIFYNFFCLRVTKKDIKVLFVTNKRFCGVREFDYLIVKKLAGDFNNKYVEYPMSTPKCRIRLIDTITKVRKSLMEGILSLYFFRTLFAQLSFYTQGDGRNL